MLKTTSNSEKKGIIGKNSREERVGKRKGRKKKGVFSRSKIKKYGKIRTSKKAEIPYPNLESWMHKRIPLPQETDEEKVERYMSQSRLEIIISSILSRIVKYTHVFDGKFQWILYRFVIGILRQFYKIRNKLEVKGLELVPKTGAIFIGNHIRGVDVVAPFLAAFKEPVGVFTTLGDGYIADLIEDRWGWVSRRGVGNIMIEKMIRAILKKNRYFVIWPEGTLERQGKVMQGFSGIVKVYATINAKKDIIPFMPFYMFEAGPHDRFYIRFLKPFFIPREWLKRPEEGGKTPREIIDYVMLKLARLQGQKELAPNHSLERRRRDHSPWKP
ncbi:MAG: lysophospholipid acyltransferase family protein [Promethearchaeota archaeon]